VKRLFAVLTTAVLVAAFMPQAFAQDAPTVHHSGTVYVEVTDGEVVAGNALIERKWARSGWATTSFLDKRSGAGVAGSSSPDFTLDVGASGLASDAFSATAVNVTEIPGGLRAEIALALIDEREPALTATRIVEVYEGIAGMRTQTIINSPAPLVLRGYTLEQAAVGDSVAPTIHAFRAGADWREPDWDGPRPDSNFPDPISVGDPHGGTWRDTHRGEAGEALAGPAQWISTAKTATLCSWSWSGTTGPHRAPATTGTKKSSSSITRPT
jgi:hypothetical protein